MLIHKNNPMLFSDHDMYAPVFLEWF